MSVLSTFLHVPTLPFISLIRRIGTQANWRWCELWYVSISFQVLTSTLLIIATKWVHHIMNYCWSVRMNPCWLIGTDDRFPNIKTCCQVSWHNKINSTSLNPDSRYYKLSTVTLYSMNKVKCSNAALAFRAVQFSFSPLGLKTSWQIFIFESCKELQK